MMLPMAPEAVDLARIMGFSIPDAVISASGLELRFHARWKSGACLVDNMSYGEDTIRK
jgi:hypothetical protein